MLMHLGSMLVLVQLLSMLLLLKHLLPYSLIRLAA